MSKCAVADSVDVARARDLELAAHVLAQAAERLVEAVVELAGADRRGELDGGRPRGGVRLVRSDAGSTERAEQLAEQRTSASDGSPARSSRATTAQRLASTSTWKRRSRGTHSRTSANSYAADRVEQLGRCRPVLHHAPPDQLQQVPLGLADPPPERRQLGAAGRAPVRWSCAWRAQITAHLTLPIASHQRIRSGSGRVPPAAS